LRKVGKIGVVRHNAFRKAAVVKAYAQGCKAAKGVQVVDPGIIGDCARGADF
tara:strand:- start:1501 stop:1656 length:156 start_codon:yes stop_codon:yes gene_type:complete